MGEGEARDDTYACTGCLFIVALCVHLHQFFNFALQAQEGMKGLQAQLQASQEAEAATQARLADQTQQAAQVWDLAVSPSLSVCHRLHLLVLYTAVLAKHSALGQMHL